MDALEQRVAELSDELRIKGKSPTFPANPNPKRFIDSTYARFLSLCGIISPCSIYQP